MYYLFLIFGGIKKSMAGRFFLSLSGYDKQTIFLRPMSKIQAVLYSLYHNLRLVLNLYVRFSVQRLLQFFYQRPLCKKCLKWLVYCALLRGHHCDVRLLIRWQPSALLRLLLD